MKVAEGPSCPDPSRRQFLISAAVLAGTPALLLPGPGDAAEAGVVPPRFSPFAAHFNVPGAGQVHFNFQDAANFSLSADAGPGSTIAWASRIYLYIAPSIASFNTGRLLLTGELAPLADRSPLANVALRPLPPAKAGAARWKVGGQLMEAQWPASRPEFTPGTLTLARLPSLAAAQLAVSRRLRRGMNMAMCGDTIERLIATWPESVTSRGWAVLAHSQGVELAGALSPLTKRIALPANLAVEDYRLNRPKAAG